MWLLGFFFLGGGRGGWGSATKKQLPPKPKGSATTSKPPFGGGKTHKATPISFSLISCSIWGGFSHQEATTPKAQGQCDHLQTTIWGCQNPQSHPYFFFYNFLFNKMYCTESQSKWKRLECHNCDSYNYCND